MPQLLLLHHSTSPKSIHIADRNSENLKSFYFLGKQTGEVIHREREREMLTDRSDVFFAGYGVEKVEIDDAELLKLLDQFDDVSVG